MKSIRFMKTSRALPVILLMITIAASGCNRAEAGKEKDPKKIRPVKAEILQPSPDVRTMVFPGKAKAAKEVSLSFRVGGPLTELLVDDGMKVMEGDIIAKIDKRDFSINVKTLEAGLAASKARFTEAERQFRRYQNLVKAAAASKSAYDQAEAGYEMALAQMNADTKNLEAARNALSDTTLYAPFTGYVHKVLVENHETVQMGQPVISLVDISRMEVEISLPESMLPETENFVAYNCIFDALAGQAFSAELKEIGKKANASNSTYPMTLYLTGGALTMVRPGMAADVSISAMIPENSERFTVPLSSLVNKSANETLVWILNRDTGSVEKRTVTVISLLKEGVEVEGALSAGEWLVTAGAHHLTDGQAARLLKKRSETNIGNVL